LSKNDIPIKLLEVKSLTEIKKITKIAILVYGIVSLIFAIILIFFLDAFLTYLNMPTWQNVAHPRMFGGALLVVVIFATLVLSHKDWEWEKIKFGYELMYLWVVINWIMEAVLLGIYFSSLSINAIGETIGDLVIMGVLGILGFYAYFKQRS
jgi:hypothetical protein